MVLLLYITLLLFLTLTCSGQDLIQINSPTNGQTISSKSPLVVSYTIIGAQTMSPPPANASYPSSMTAQFQWLQKGTQGNPLWLSALGGLETRNYVAGIQNKAYTASWNVPNCHFFSRYNPSNFDFSLVFSPVYSDSTVQNQQGPISIPLNIQVNNATFPKC